MLSKSKEEYLDARDRHSSKERQPMFGCTLNDFDLTKHKMNKTKVVISLIFKLIKFK